MIRSIRDLKFFLAILCLASVGRFTPGNELTPTRQRFLYVSSPGIRDDLTLGGHGVLVFDINKKHRFVKRIPLAGYGLDQKGKVLNVKGICANANTYRLYVSTLEQLICVDLSTE